MNWREHIVSDPKILRGKPCIKGTRIPAALVLGYLAAGRGADAIRREFPDLTQEDVAQTLGVSRSTVANRPFRVAVRSIVATSFTARSYPR